MKLPVQEIRIKETIDTKRFALPINKALKSCPKLQEFITYVNEKPRLDLGDSQALSTYNTCLFQVLEGIRIHLPQGNLIPTCGLRRSITYLIQKHVTPEKKVLEVGTGASGIMAILLAKKGYQVIATDIDPKSLQYAKENAKENKVFHKIQFIQSPGGILSWIPSDFTKDLALVFSLPPYYSIETKEKSVMKKKRGFLGTTNELFTSSTPESFSVQLLQEALELGQKNLQVGVLWKNKDSMLQGMKQLEALPYKTIIYQLKAGTRTRYFTFSTLDLKR